MEAVGVALAVPAVVQQLLKVCVAGYDLFTAAQSVGVDMRNRLHDLDVSKQIFKDWIRDLARHNDSLIDIIQPNSKRYELILLDLSLIARVFTEVEQLENKYGISRIGQVTGDDNRQAKAKVETEGKVRVAEGSLKVSYRSTLHKARSVFKRSQSKNNHSVHKGIKADAPLGNEVKAAPLSPTSSVVVPSTPLNFDSIIPNEIDLGARASDMELFTKQMSLDAAYYQEVIPRLKRYQWAYTSGEQLNSLISDLQKYVEHLRALTEYPMRWSQSAPALALPAPFYEFKVGKQLPYPRLHTFRGREYLIQDVQDSLMSSNIGDGVRYKRAVVVLRGMGGIGKSQVALEYIYRYPEAYSAVFWVDGTSQSTANESGRQILQTLIAHYSTKHHSKHTLVDVATDLGIPGQLKIDGTLSDEVVKKPWPAIKRWMAREGNSRWCLVIDGLNVPEDISTMEEVLPPCDYGHIIVTSRVAVRECKIIEVELLDKASSLSLLLGGQVENAAEEVKEAAEATAQKLGYLPLALSQVAAYVVNCALDYVEYLSRLTRNMARYIGETISKKYANGVFSCWQLSVETLMQSMPQSIELLRLCSFLSPSGVSKELLDRGLSAMGCFKDDHFRFEEAIDLLVQYSLMKRITSNGARTEQVYWMHPLVRLWAEETYLDGDSIVLERDPKRLKSMFTQGALNAVSLVGCSLNPRSEPRETNEWAYERRNMTHITLCLDTYMQECTTVAGEAATTIKVAVALANFGWYKFYWVEEHASAEITKLSIKLFDRLLRENPSQELRLHRFIAQEQLLSNYIAGELLGNDPKDLEEIVDEMISEGERIVELNYSFRQSLQCMRGAILVVQQRHEEARTALEKCVEENEALLAPGNAESMAAIHWLARTYWGVGDTETAESLFGQALALNMEYQGPNHRETLNSLWWLSECRRLLGDLQGQSEYLKRTAEASEAMYGLANRNTMGYLADLVKCYRQDGQDDEAEAVIARMDEAEVAIARMDEAGWVIKDAGTLPD